MPRKSLYDTRFFVEYFYSGDGEALRGMKEDIRSAEGRMVSAVTVHEVYRIDLGRLGRDVARLRCETIRRDFQVVDVGYEVAVRSAELRSRYRVPMADSVIAATALMNGCVLVSDDPHFQGVEGLRTRWPLR
jgi:predicted nucleic acid-binding protein